MKIFYRLNEARTSLGQDESIYCNVNISKNNRYFIVGSEWDMFKEYIESNKSVATEIILEDKPCHFYIDIDLDYNKCENNVLEVWNQLQTIVMPMLGKYSDNDDIDVRIHDSSDDKKGSLHIICICKHHIFHRNYSVGAFMKCVRNVVFKENLEFLKYCFEEGFIDMSVYSRNRQFRMLGCYKWSNKTKSYGRLLRDTSGEQLSFRLWQYSKVQPIFTDKKEIDVKDPEGINGFSVASVGITNRGIHEPFFENLISFAKDSWGNIRNYKFYPLTMVICVTYDQKRCPLMPGHVHKTNDSRMVINMKNNAYYFKCWSDRCKHISPTIKPLPDDICTDMNAWLGKKIKISINKR
jgi:hypothetical protein